MAIRVKHNVLVQISDDTSGDEKRYYPSSKELTIDGYDKYSVKNFAVAAAATKDMDLSDITAPRGLYLESDGDVDVVINGTATLSLRKSSTTTGVTAKLFFEGIISSITIDNSAGASAVNGDIVLWGDTTP